MQQHQDFVRSHEISYSGYLKEVAECRAFCAPLVANLMKCQVLSVSRNVHGIVLFGLGSDSVDARYAQGTIANVTSRLAQDDESKVVLIGRASKVGDLKYNRRLAARRALAARDSLIEQGVPRDRIETMWFGWEPPQISSWVADEYGMRDLYNQEGPLRMNQSVMLVIY